MPSCRRNILQAFLHILPIELPIPCKWILHRFLLHQFNILLRPILVHNFHFPAEPCRLVDGVVKVLCKRIERLNILLEKGFRDFIIIGSANAVAKDRAPGQLLKDMQHERGKKGSVVPLVGGGRLYRSPPMKTIQRARRISGFDIIRRCAKRIPNDWKSQSSTSF